MREKMTGIVLNVRKYNDKNNIVTIYSRDHGRLAFISPIGSGKTGSARRARLQPLSIISTELNLKAGADLQRLPSVSLDIVWRDLYFDPVKRAIVIFISEFLYRLLHATQADEKLWDFIAESLLLLDNMQNRYSDFHISFLVSLLPFMGIQPDVSGYASEKVFDFASGSFVASTESQGPVLRGREAQDVLWVKRLNFFNIGRIRFSRIQRRDLLQKIISYYSFHYPGLSSLKSLDVLQEIFD